MRVTVHTARNIDHPFPVLAWGIMLFQGMNPFKCTSFNHMAIEFKSEGGNDYIFEATGKHGVNTRPKFEFEKTYKIIDSYTLNLPTNGRQFLIWARSLEGIQYDRLQVYGLMLKNLFSFVTFNKIGHNQRKIICSELVILMLMKFCNLKVRDTDNYDLIDARKLVKQRAIYGSIPKIT